MKIKLRLLLLLLTGTLACNEEYQEVQVSGPDGQIIRVLRDPSELQIILEYWRQRQEMEKPSDIPLIYHVNVRQGEHWTTWQYHPDGWMQVLTKQRVPIYKISSPATVNAILGMHDK